MVQNNLPERVLIVDDDPGDANALASLLNKEGVNTKIAKDLSTALYIFNNSPIDLVVIEHEFVELPGLVLAQKWRKHELLQKQNVSIVLSCGRNLTGSDNALMNELGDIVAINKPFVWTGVIPTIINSFTQNKQRVKLLEIKTKIIDPLLRKGNFDLAIKVADEKLVRLGLRGQKLAIKVFEQANMPEYALQLLNKMNNDYPNDLEVKNALGRIYLQLGEFDQARTMLEAADKVAPNNIERLEQLAEFYLKNNAPDKSVEKYKTLLTLSPENPDLKYQYIEKVSAAGYEDAALKFSKEVSTSLEVIRYYNNKGVLFSKNNDFVSAIDEYKKALKYAAGNKNLYRIMYNLAIAHINLKNAEQYRLAEKVLEDCLVLEPKYDKALQKLTILKNFFAGKSVKLHDQEEDNKAS